MNALSQFERLRVFVVEDNPFIRETMTGLLRHLSIRTIVTAESGTDAIAELKQMKLTNMSPDFVISDLVMSPINGLLLLRWVRMSPESPNRFMPFMMVSGAADSGYVNASRDMGVSEFLAKPFSSASMLEKIVALINYPRPFIMSLEYFGPDRRRRKLPAPNETERRKTSKEDMTVVYSPDQISKATDKAALYVFRFPNKLKEKVAGSFRGPITVPTEVLEKAEEEMERKSLNFKDWALNYLAQLTTITTDALMDTTGRAEHFEKINLIALELRGQGGVFGYPIISIAGKMLYDVTHDGCAVDDTALEIAKAHTDTMKAVLREDIRGDGGQIGRQLIEGLRQAVLKKQKSRPKTI